MKRRKGVPEGGSNGKKTVRERKIGQEIKKKVWKRVRSGLLG